MTLDLRAVAHALGGRVTGRDTALVPGPGHSARDRSLAVRLDPAAPDGFLVYSHAGDDWKTCRDHVRSRLGLPDWESGDEQVRTIPQRHVKEWDLAAIEAEIEETPCAWNEDEQVRIALANRVWDEGRDPRRTLGERYLRESRKLGLPKELCGSVLRFSSHCPWRNENDGTLDRVPALLLPFRSVDDNSITGIHRIALNSDGTKLGRRMLGVVRRAAIKFDLINCDTLAVGEGVETALAARQLGFTPVWALGSVGAITFLLVIEGVKRLLILGESGDASAHAIKFCGRRWRKAGRQVRIVMPDVGDDLNDVVAQRAMS
jgi:putative DNA primase/helicase